jgi:very-short-patch-repair endonuclease
LPTDAVFVGATAAHIHGLDLVRDYVEVAVPPTSGIRSRRGLMVRHLSFAADDVVTYKNTRITCMHRTLRDMCVSEPAVEALVAIDMAIRLRRTSTEALAAYIARKGGLPGVRRLRKLAAMAAPAESPMETRLRWLLLSAGLPKPEVQVNLHDRDGEFLGRADLYYPQARLVIEFDGGNHRERLVSDNRRQNLLIRAGFRILRFTAADIFRHPEVVAAQVRGSL